MITRINYQLLSLIAFVTLAFSLFAGIQFLQPTVAQAVDVPTYPFKLTKSISDNKTPDPYQASEFKFHVTGNGVDTIVDLIQIGENTAENVVELPEGTYTVEEVGPAGFVPEDWTLQWSGYGCDNDSEGYDPVRPTDILVQEAADPDAGGNVCKADNQWRGEPAPILGCTDQDAENYDPAAEEDDNSCIYENEIPGCTDPIALNYNSNATIDNGTCEYDGGNGGTGTIVIEKQTLPNGDQTQFTFDPSWSASNFTLVDGTQSTTTGLTAGTYSVVESLPTNWTQTSVVCSDGSSITAISLQANEKVTCVVTNTQDGGGGDNETPKWLVFGYVWHDANSNDNWEKDNPETEEVEGSETDLDGWTVQITNGSVTYSTTTDSTGYYFFYVPFGTWTISEVLQSEWNQTYPNDNTYIVVVGNTTQAAKQNFFAVLMNYVLPTAYAQSPTTYGPYNFGNVQGNSYSQGSYGGGGGGGGGRNRNNDDDNDPIPQVLGDATTVVPVGAPNTGAGGAAPVAPTLPSLFAILTATNRTVRISKNG